jgi:hypothetical protein
MHHNTEPDGVTFLALLLAIAILIGLIIQSFFLRNIENKIDNFTSEEIQTVQAQEFNSGEIDLDKSLEAALLMQ